MQRAIPDSIFHAERAARRGPAARSRPGTRSYGRFGARLTAAVVVATLLATGAGRVDAADAGRSTSADGGGIPISLGEGATVLLPAELAERADALVRGGGDDLGRQLRRLLRRHAASDPATAMALGRYLARRHPEHARRIRRGVRRLPRGANADTGRGELLAPERDSRRAAEPASDAAAQAAPQAQTATRGLETARTAGDRAGVASDTGQISGGAGLGGAAPAPQDTLLASPGVTVQAPDSRVASPTRP